MESISVEIKEELYFCSRGIGGSGATCYCCGKDASNDLCGFVKIVKKEEPLNVH